MMEPHPINPWCSPHPQADCLHGIGSVPLSSVRSLITQFSVYWAALAPCTFSSKAAIDCMVGKQNQPIFWELSANHNAVNSLMVPIHLARVTAERNPFSMAREGGEVVPMTPVGRTRESRHKKQAVGFAPARTHLGNCRAHCQRFHCLCCLITYIK